MSFLVNFFSKDERFNQGILIYCNNRLIRRFEATNLGNLEFLIGNPLFNETDIKNIRLFDYSGYIELKSIFKPNLMKTVIINILLYFSIFVIRRYKILIIQIIFIIRYLQN